jgi:hypothetical protein
MSDELDFTPRELVKGVVERREFIEQVRQIAGVTAKGLDWIDEVLDFKNNWPASGGGNSRPTT